MIGPKDMGLCLIFSLRWSEVEQELEQRDINNVKNKTRINFS
jgi:hypothetical protein